MNIISGIIKYLKIHSYYLGKRIYILFFLTIAATFSEGLGLTLFLPLLNSIEQNDKPDDGAGSIIYKFLEIIGVQASVLNLLLLISILFIIKGGFTFLEGAYRSFLRGNLMRKLKANMFDAYSNMDYHYYLQKDTGHFTNVINEQVNEFYRSFSHFTLSLSSIVMTFCYLTFAFFITWQFALMALIIGMFLLMIYSYLNIIVTNLSNKTSIELSDLNKFLIQALQSYKYTSATDQMVHLRKGVKGSIDKLTGYQVRQQLATAFTTAIREPLSILFVLGIVAFQVLILDLPLAPILVALLIFHRCMRSIFEIQLRWQQAMSRIGGVHMVDSEFKILKQNREISGNQKLRPLNKGIQFIDVSFSYNNDSSNVIDNVNIFIPVNSTVAFIGESGSGKSTLIDLLPLLHKPRSGTILIDDISVNKVELASWRSQIGYVSQETVIFNASIFNNISLWSDDVSSEISLLNRVQKAANKAYLHDFIMTLEDGYNTMVGDRGIRLSGGQQQRLFIARELFKDPNLLILDEATSALDTESEQYIQKSIDSLKGYMTVVIIAHRLSTIRNVDYVYLLESGKVVEEGTYQNLRQESNSRLSKMINMQTI